MIVHKCDRCGTESPQKKGERVRTPKDWRDIQVGRYAAGLDYELCPKCVDELKIPKGDQDADKDIAARLIELIEEIATEAVQQ